MIFAKLYRPESAYKARPRYQTCRGADRKIGVVSSLSDNAHNFRQELEASPRFPPRKV